MNTVGTSMKDYRGLLASASLMLTLSGFIATSARAADGYFDTSFGSSGTCWSMSRLTIKTRGR